MALLKILIGLLPFYFLCILWFSDPEEEWWRSSIRPLVSVPVCLFLAVVVACFWLGHGVNYIKKKIV